MARRYEPWLDDGTPFGNATGLDYVSLDVLVTIARRFGATVLIGKLPADIAAEQPARREAAERHYGERASHLTPREPFAKFTISQDGLAFSGDDADGHSSTSGYRSHYWQDRIGPDTVVFDLRTVPDDQIVTYAVRGPMCDPSLPAGSLSTLRIPADDFLRSVADAYLAPFGGVAATGSDRP